MMLAARSDRGWPGWKVFLLIFLGVSSGRVLFSVYDRIARKESFFSTYIPPSESKGILFFFSALGIAGLLLCGILLSLLQGNWLPAYLSIAASVFICLAPLVQRFGFFYTFFQGAVYALIPIGVWVAIKGSLSWQPFFLGLITISWISGLDALYSIRTEGSDRQKGLQSLVIAWGVQNALSFAFLAHLIAVMLMAVFGFFVLFKMAYMIAVGFIALCILMEHGIAKIRKKHWVGKAFERLDIIISIVYLAGVACEVIFPFFNFSAQ